MTKRTDSGFTLLEVMLSLAVIGTVMVTVIYTLNYHIDVASVHETATVAVSLGTEKLSELRTKPREESGAFAEPYGDYHYETHVGESAYPGITELAVTVARGDDEVTLKELLFDEAAWTGGGDER